MMSRMNRMVLAFVLVTFSSCVVHAQGKDVSSKDKSGHVEKGKARPKKDNAKQQKDDADVVYLDMSDDKGESDDGMPAITKKGPL